LVWDLLPTLREQKRRSLKVKFNRFVEGFVFLLLLTACQGQSPVKKIELVFPWSTKQGRELERAFDGGGILLKIKAENTEGAENELNFQIHSLREMEQVILPAHWFQEELLRAIEAEVELVSDKLESENNKRYGGRLVLDSESNYPSLGGGYLIFLQELAL